MKITHTLFQVVVALILLLPLELLSQDDSELKKQFVESESYFLFEEYKDALPGYQKILREEPENFNVKYKIGICYLNDPYQKEKSLKYLAEAAQHINKQFKINNFKEKMAPPEANFYLGQAYMVTGNINEALEFFTLFKNELNPEVFDVNVVNEEIKSCQIALKMVESPVYKTSTSFNEKINSRFADYNPIISNDGKTLIFTRKLQFYDAVFISKLDNYGVWSEPYNLTPDFGLDGNTYSTGISADGTEIFVYRSDNFDGNIYSSKFINNKWQKLVKLNDNINTKYWESHASPSPDGKFLYFTSNRKGGYGGLDIYRAPLISGNNWGVPVSLGPIVNSVFNEETPFVTADNKLFFSSLGHGTMGGYDIYVTQQAASGSWSKPVNMGYPVNTTDDDLFFAPVISEKHTAVYSHYDEGSTLGLSDIYWIKAYNSFFPRNFTVKGQIATPTEKMLSNGDINVSIIDNKTGKVVEQTTANEKGEFLLVVPQGNYQLLVDGNGIKPYTMPLDLSVTQEDETLVLPLIITQAAVAGEDQPLAITATIPRLDVVGQEYIITNEAPVSIDLKLEKGSQLTVQHYVDNKIQDTKQFAVTDENFSYEFTPLPGENRIVFTITDSKGNVNTKEVTVMYQPDKEQTPLTQSEPNTKLTPAAEAALIASPALKRYLESLESLEFESMSELYLSLLENAEANGFTEDDVDQLFTVILSQRNKDEFLSSASEEGQFPEFNSNDTSLSSIVLPVILVKRVSPIVESSKNDFQVRLINVVPVENSWQSTQNYIVSFSGMPTYPAEMFTDSDTSGFYANLIKTTGAEQTTKTIELAATTRELNQFYLNLLATSKGDLKAILSGLALDSLEIVNSIQLVDYLFEQADAGKINRIDLINQIEKANQQEYNNIQFFKDALAEAATGMLKLHIQEMKLNYPEDADYNRIIELLLKNSGKAGYGPIEVYDLLIKQIGITDVKKFVNEMMKYSTGDIDSLLRTLDLNQYSSPLEVIQYLLSMANDYQYSESDINNLLIRMLLEKGVGVGQDSGKSAYSKFFMEHKRLSTSLVLSGIFAVIMLILFWRRRRKKENN